MVLAEAGVFYERQKGKFEAEMKSVEAISRYRNTNGTKVIVVELGQLICLSRRWLQLSAKPSDVFASKEEHDRVFTWDVPNEHIRDIVWSFNAFKAAKSALTNYLRLPAHENEQTHTIFAKPLVRHSLYYVCLMHLYQRCQFLAAQFAFRLNKKAPGLLGKEAEVLYKKVISKTKAWYLDQSRNLETDVSWKRLDAFVTQLCNEAGLDSDGPMPFTDKQMDWDTVVPSDDQSSVQ
jgi:hypothetical protein